nr:uncharacterized protein LOC111516255 [Leptinotarsa decemlineata]
MPSRLQPMAVPTLYLRDEIDLFDSDEPSTSSAMPLTLVWETDSFNENAVGCLMSPLQLLKHSGVCKQAVTPRKKSYMQDSKKTLAKDYMKLKHSRINMNWSITW